MRYFTKTAELSDTQKLLLILGGAGVGAASLGSLRRGLGVPRLIPKTNPEISDNLDLAADTVAGGIGGGGLGYLLTKLLGD